MYADGVSIIIPAYNEAENVKPLLEDIDTMFKDYQIKGEVIFVDDGSLDNTLAEVKNYQKNYSFLEVYSHRKNLGITDVLLTGLRHAKFDTLVIFPADLQYSPTDIPRLLSEISHGYDVVAGWRQGKYEKWFTSLVYNWLSRLIFHIRIHDMNSIKAFRRKVIEDIILNSDWHRYLIPLADEKGYKISEVKIKLFPRRHGVSKYSNPFRLIIGIVDMISVKFKISFSRKPMLLLGTSGLFFLIIGLSLAVIYAYSKFFHNLIFTPSITLVAIFIISGIQLFAAGFICDLILELLGRLKRNEKKDTPF